MSDDPSQPRRPRPPREPAAPRREEPPSYTKYRSGPGFLSRLRGSDEPKVGGGRGGLSGLRQDRAERRQHRTRQAGKRARGSPILRKRVLKYVALAVIVWVAISLVAFLISAQFEQEHVSDAADTALDSGGPILTSSSTVLVLGSDRRTARTNDTGGALTKNAPSRSDTILLMRVGPGKAARLSIPRDTVVEIPGSGRSKINAAYAIGGPALAITTVKQFLGIEINHVIDVNFDNFPQLIDSLGGVNVKTGCVKDKISGGDENGGVTIDIPAGKNHLDGRHALALARVRKNSCKPAENDLDRAKRQQAILSAIKGKVASPFAFLRLPWISWNAPKAIRSDMSGPSLLQLFMVMSTKGSPQPRVLKPSGYLTLPDGGSGLTISDEEKQAEVARFLRG